MSVEGAATLVAGGSQEAPGFAGSLGGGRCEQGAFQADSRVTVLSSQEKGLAFSQVRAPGTGGVRGRQSVSEAHAESSTDVA